MSWQMELALKLENIIEDEAWHFVLAFISGWLVWLLIQTIFGAAGSIFRRISRSPVSMPKGLRYFTTILAVSSGFVAVWYSHVALDSFVLWFNSPMGTHPTADTLWILWLLALWK